jgi:hypothetical protein
LSSGEGGGVAQLGFVWHDVTDPNRGIQHNSILFNQSTNPTIPTNGGGLVIEGTPDTDPVCGTQPDQDCPPGLSDGTGPGLLINANLIQGNSADSGSGGGLRLQSVNGTEVSTFPRNSGLWYSVDVTNNIIVNNVAGWDGAGVSLQDALVANIVNNTIAHNDSTATSGVLINTLGAPDSSTPGGNCVQTGPSGARTASCPQASGLVSMPNTTLLTTTFTGLQLSCPADHPTCRRFSNPLLANDLFWQNRAFQIGVGGFGAGDLNQQKIVTIFNADANFSRTSVGSPAASQASTGACPGGSSYWDIGVRGDRGPSNHASGLTLAPTYSVLTSIGDYTGLHNLGSDPLVVSQYCNGSRVPPELCTTSGALANGVPCTPGWQVPPGIADAVVPNPVFSLTPAATVDEGNNWINLTWGPLSLTNMTVKGADGNWGGGAPLGNYALSAASTAIDRIPVAQSHPGRDFFGNPRPDPANLTHFDPGAVEFQGAGGGGGGGNAPTLTRIDPNSAVRGSGAQPVTLTGTNFTAGATVNVSGNQVSVSNVNVMNATTITATFTIGNGNSGVGSHNVTVTTANGTTNPPVTFTVTP